MKKNLLLKIFLLLSILVYVFFTDSIYAVDLEFMANVTRGPTIAEINADANSAKGKTSELATVIRTYSKNHEQLSADSDWSWYGKDTTGSSVTYTTYGASFWGNSYSANYHSPGTGGSSSYCKFTYDTYSGYVEATSDSPRDNLPSYSGLTDANGNMVSYSTTAKDTGPDLTFDLWGSDGCFYRKRSKELSMSGYTINVHDSVITKKGIDKILETYYKNGDTTYVKNGNLRINFSLMAHTGVKELGYLSTTHKASEAASWMNARNSGYSGSGASIGTSLLNYYDNWLNIPLAKLNPRTLTVVHKVKDRYGNFYIEKTEELKFGSDAYTYSKPNIGDNNIYYIGGKISSGSTKEAAKNNISSSTNNWGWDTTSKTIGASNNEEHYYIEMYYDYRNLTEQHLKTDGTVINSAWNNDAKSLNWPLTKNDYTFRARAPHTYYNNQKYVYVNAKYDGNTTTSTSVTFSKLDGGSSLKMGDTHYVYFYYEYEPPREVYVRHFVYNDSTGNYERSTLMTNTNAAVLDNEDGKYYLRSNGFNQRKLKSGSASYTDSVPSGYNEMYIIDYDDTIKLDKSRTLQNDGIEYTYKGYKVQNSTAPAVLTKAQANTLSNSINRVTLTGEEVTKTYVDFYYMPSAIVAPGGEADDPDGDITGSPTINFIPKDDSGTNIGPDSGTQTSKVTYVPSDENLKAYISGSTYRPYSLIYYGNTINNTTGEIGYKLKKYDVYKFVNGAIKNNSDSNYGYINSTDKKGVFNTNNDVWVTPISNNIKFVVQGSISVYQDKSPLSVAINDGRATVESDFGTGNIHEVKYDKYNGVRNRAGIANYDVVSLISTGTEVYNVKPYSTKTVNTKNNTQVNVFTPVVMSDIVIESEKTVNHSNQDTYVIQKNSEFKITPVTGKTTDYSAINDTVRYVKYYWLVTDFDIKLINTQTVFDKASGTVKTLYKDQIVRAGNLIKIARYGSFSGIATNEEDTGDIVNQFSNKIKVVPVVHNVTDDDFENKIISNIKATTSYSFVDANKNNKNTTSTDAASTDQAHKSLGAAQVNSMYDDAHYFAAYTQTSKNIGRVYDFKITDCLDINLKNIFRKSNNGNVNDLRGVKFYSGLRKLLVYGGSGVQLGTNRSNNNNIFIERETTDTSINQIVSKTILPFGPYKHIDTNYIQAPKLGYRISFDLKTSGAYFKESTDTSVRYIKITPSYYYISKDGKTFKENINLYYKNSSGKYVNFEGSGYTIYFKPNDGYRTVYNPDAPELKDMSTKLEALKIGGTSTDKSFILTDNMMSYSDNNFVQAWYGEFKLPNSTIAVEVDASGKKDINNPLTDGYIGVRFDIKCVDKETSSTPESEATIVSYNLNDKTAAEEGLTSNTSQWDYEGYLGFEKENVGKDLNDRLRIQLEKGFWEINTQEIYNKMKSTVVLYDTDNRAADDFS